MDEKPHFESACLVIKLKVRAGFADCFYQGQILGSFTSDAENTADLIQKAPSRYPIAENEVVVIFQPVKILRNQVVTQSKVVIEDWNTKS